MNRHIIKFIPVQGEIKENDMFRLYSGQGERVRAFVLQQEEDQDQSDMVLTLKSAGVSGHIGVREGGVETEYYVIDKDVYVILGEPSKDSLEFVKDGDEVEIAGYDKWESPDGPETPVYSIKCPCCAKFV